MAKQKKRPEETDLDQLKHLAHVFLELDIASTKFSPVVVKHLFMQRIPILPLSKKMCSMLFKN